MWKCTWIAGTALALLGLYCVVGGSRRFHRTGGGPSRGIVAAPGQRDQGAAPASVGEPPAPLAGNWLDESDKTLAGLRGETQRGDEDLLRWLVGFSARFTATPGAVEDALAALSAGKGSERFRAVLELLVAVSSDTAGQAEFRRISLSKEALAAGAALRAIFLRIEHVKFGPPLAPWFEHFWVMAMADLYIGDMLDPGELERASSGSPGMCIDGSATPGSPSDGVFPDNWPDPHVREAGEEVLETLETIAADGQAPAAKMPALRELPEGPRTDRVAQAILRDDRDCPLLRAFCYEQLDERNPSNWPLLKHALETETNPRALASAVHAALASSPASELISALEALGERIPLESSGALDAVTEDLSIMETQEALDALVRMVRFARSDTVRFSAASKIAFCAYGSPFTQPRIDALLGLVRDVDPVVAAMGGSALLDARSSNALRDVAAPAMDASVMARIQSLSADPHVPTGLREALTVRLRDANPQPPK